MEMEEGGCIKWISKRWWRWRSGMVKYKDSNGVENHTGGRGGNGLSSSITGTSVGKLVALVVDQIVLFCKFNGGSLISGGGFW